MQSNEHTKQSILIYIRFATAEDIPACIEITKQVYSTVYKQIEPLVSEKEWEEAIDSLSALSDPFYRYTSQLLVVETETKKIVGCMMVYPFCLPNRDLPESELSMRWVLDDILPRFHTAGPVAFISRLYIDENYRNNGIGKKLLKTAFICYPKVEALYLDTLALNKKAADFYRHVGFVEYLRFNKEGDEIIVFSIKREQLC